MSYRESARKRLKTSHLNQCIDRVKKARALNREGQSLQFDMIRNEPPPTIGERYYYMFDNQKRKIEVRSDDGFFRVFTDGDCVIEIDSTKHAAQVSNFETIATEFFIFCDRAYRKAASYRKPKKRRKKK